MSNKATETSAIRTGSIAVTSCPLRRGTLRRPSNRQRWQPGCLNSLCRTRRKRGNLRVPCVPIRGQRWRQRRRRQQNRRWRASMFTNLALCCAPLAFQCNVLFFISCFLFFFLVFVLVSAFSSSFASSSVEIATLPFTIRRLPVAHSFLLLCTGLISSNSFFNMVTSAPNLSAIPLNRCACVWY